MKKKVLIKALAVLVILLGVALLAMSIVGILEGNSTYDLFRKISVRMRDVYTDVDRDGLDSVKDQYREAFAVVDQIDGLGAENAKRYLDDTGAVFALVDTTEVTDKIVTYADNLGQEDSLKILDEVDSELNRATAAFSAVKAVGVEDASTYLTEIETALEEQDPEAVFALMTEKHGLDADTKEMEEAEKKALANLKQFFTCADTLTTEMGGSEALEYLKSVVSSSDMTEVEYAQNLINERYAAKTDEDGGEADTEEGTEETPEADDPALIRDYTDSVFTLISDQGSKNAKTYIQGWLTVVSVNKVSDVGQAEQCLTEICAAMDALKAVREAGEEAGPAIERLETALPAKPDITAEKLNEDPAVKALKRGQRKTAEEFNRKAVAIQKTTQDAALTIDCLKAAAAAGDDVTDLDFARQFVAERHGAQGTENAEAILGYCDNVLSQIESQVRNQGSKDDVKSRIEKMLKHMENNSISSAKEYLYYQNASNKTVVEALDVVFEKGAEYAKEHGGDICADIQEKAASDMSGEQLQKARTFQNDLWALMNQVGLEKTKKYIQYASEDALTDKTLRISELGTGNVKELDALDSNKVFLMRNKAILMILAIICLIAGIVMLIIRPSEDAQPKLTREQRKQAGQHMGLKTSRIIANSLIHALLIVISVIWLIPFISIVMQSLRVESTYQVGYVMPEKVGFYNYSDLFTTDFPTWYLNTFIMALAVAVLQTLIVLCMSYTLSRFRFKMRKPLMKFMLILGMFPGMLSMIILYRVLKDLGMTQAHSVPGLILVYVASSGMGYYVSKGFFDTIPKSLDEAARIDGATRAQVLYKIILPLSKPIVIYTVLTAFMGPWGDYVFAKYVSNNTTSGMNAAVGLNTWLSMDQIAKRYTMFCAGGVLVAIPVTVLFMCLQRYYVEGVTGGAVKG